MRRLVPTVFILLAISGCASGPTKQDIGPVTKEITSSKSLTILAPKEGVNIDNFVHIEKDLAWGAQYGESAITINGNNTVLERQELLRIHKKDNQIFQFERRVDDGTSKSAGVIYDVKQDLNFDNNRLMVKYTPIRITTYNNKGLIFSFSTPTYSQDDLFSSILKNYLGYDLSFNSKYDSTSIISNFKRLAKKYTWEAGSRDPLTGKIYEDTFSVMYKGVEIPFSVEVYPYHGGSKVLVHFSIQGEIALDTSSDKYNINYSPMLAYLKDKIHSIIYD